MTSYMSVFNFCVAVFLLLAAACAQQAPAKLEIAQQNGQWRVAGPTLEAFVGPDGCVNTLRLPFAGENWTHVPNVLKPGLGPPTESGTGGSRGAFFFQDGQILRLMDVKKIDATTIAAESDKAAARYVFSDAELTWTLTNKSEQPMQFLMVLDPSVNAVRSDAGAWKKTPVNELWTAATWFQGKRRLHIAGGSRLWGPGPMIGQDFHQGHFQVYEALLAPKETRTLTLTPGVATADETTTMAGIAPEVPFRGTGPSPMLDPRPAAAGDLTVYSPRDYQVFQRQTRALGRIRVAGEVKPRCDAVEVRVCGQGLDGRWQPVPLEAARQAFSAEIPAPAGGWYQVEFRAKKGADVVAQAAVPHVGLGEVFITCGQSNSTSCGEPRQSTTSGMVAAFSGLDWQLANDPQPGAFDSIEKGSCWPAFGDALYAKYHVPIGISVTGQGGAPVSAWEPGKPAFVWLMTRALTFGPGGFRAILWHQGESNVHQSGDYYFAMLSTTIKASRAAAGWSIPCRN